MEHTIEFKLNESTDGGFYIFENNRQIAELEFSVENNILNAYHTGVRKELEGQGIAQRLFDAMVEYARENHYRITPSCSYILAKFRRHPDEFGNIWYRMEDEPTGNVCGIKPKK